jgi:8-oxo-dGTP pyrophosphatase MutT (NUDIX family)
MVDTDWAPKDREESFGVIVFRGDKKQEVLLVETDHWGFPKGHPELGEDGLTAALREVKEETGISPYINNESLIFRDQYEVRRDGRTTKKTVTYWVGSGEGEVKPQPGEIQSARWVPVQEALHMLSYDGVRNLFRGLL